MFLYVYVDIFAFYKPGTIPDILRGRVWDFEITQGWALALLTIPSVMIALSVLLPTRANQWTNIVVGSLFILVSIGNPIGETWVHLVRRDRRGRAARDGRAARVALARGARLGRLPAA
jgi:Family of unknown function (DUF6326)